MLRKEYDRKQNGRIRAGCGKLISNPVSCISTTPPGSDSQTLYKGQKDTERVCSRGLVKRNTAGNASPFAQGNLLDELGFMGEKSAVTEILAGTYTFPPECNERAQRICKEACKLYSKITEETIHSYVTRKHFQTWWRTANKDI